MQSNTTKTKTTLTNTSIEPRRESASTKFDNLQRRIVLKRNEYRVVFYKISEAGYGNRIYSMLSAFLAAVVIDGALLIDWPMIDQYIDCPLQNVFSKFKDLSFLDINQKNPQICHINARSANTWSYNKQLNFLQSE